jgi:predicted GIY-YIG superfamily endonuclease
LCVDGVYYVGQTANLETRLLQHNNGQCKTTKYRLPVQIVYTEKFTSRKEAMSRERIIKSFTRDRKRRLIESLYVSVHVAPLNYP